MQYSIIRSRRKTVALEVTRKLEIIVRAPLRFPQQKIESFVQNNLGWIEKAIQKQQQHESTYPEPTDAEQKQLREQAKNHIPQRVAYYSAVMGLVPTGIKITSAKRRFGSCSAKNSLCFSWRLMQYPPDAIDYVVVHELAHIVHKNHGAAFYKLIAKYMPNYNEHRATLRK